MQAEDAQGVARCPAGESLAGKVWRPAEGVADADVAELIDRRACHPPIGRCQGCQGCQGCVGALLVQGGSAATVQPELVPADAAATRRRVHRVHRDNRFLVADSPIDDAGHELVALRVEPAVGAGLWHAVSQLAVTEVAIRRDGDPRRSFQTGLRHVFPVREELPRDDRIGGEVLPELRAAGCQHDVRRAPGGQPRAVEVGVVQEVDVVDDEALLARGLALEHGLALDDTGVLLDDFIAGAGRHVVAIGPHRRTGVVREKGPEKFIAVVSAHRVACGAYGIAHGVGPLRSRHWCLRPAFAAGGRYGEVSP